MISVLLRAVFLMVGSVAVAAPAAVDQALPVPDARGSYVVAIASSAFEDAGWREAAQILREKHDADLVVVPDAQVEAVLPMLQRVRPRYVCFVARPDEIGVEVVARMHRLMRRIDDDAYTDATWAILTGYEAGDAVRIARRSEPLIISSGFSSMGPGLPESFGAGFASSETDAGAFWTVDAQGKTRKQAVEPDPTAALAEAFATIPVEVMHTSGHATEMDWQIGYNVKAGEIRCDEGRLYAKSTSGARHYFESPHAKVYMPMGNCLIGHVPGQDCMATAWMHSGGVYQMYGYTAVTFFGYMGWGVGTYFSNGSLSLAQAFHANGHALIHQLQTRFPDQADVTFTSHNHRDIQSQANRFGIRDRDLMGLLWDRDAVAFYGDPAWQARMPIKARGWTLELSSTKPEDGGAAYTLTIVTLADGSWPNRPLVIPLVERLTAIDAVHGPDGLDPVVTDDFVLLPLKGDYMSNTEVRVTFNARLAELAQTHAGSEPVRLDRALQAPDGREALSNALSRAGENSGELQQALRAAPEAQRVAMEFLIANMPEPDLRTLDADFLLKHVSIAWEAWQAAPWRGQVDEALFLNAVLPYAGVDEQRELWIEQMRARCLPMVETCKMSGEAAIALNEKLFKAVGVAYHATKRPKPSQNPSESIAAGYASCTGLSILLVDACRSVGIPARVAGVPQWASGGNHTWVEVWDGVDWQPVGAAESHRLGDVWFGDAAANADNDHPLRRIYATQFVRSGTHFPLAWNMGYEHVSATNVTARYRRPKAQE